VCWSDEEILGVSLIQKSICDDWDGLTDFCLGVDVHGCDESMSNRTSDCRALLVNKPGS
jgi:hypothetical protein